MYKSGEDEPEELPAALEPLDERLFLDHRSRTSATESKLGTHSAFVTTTIIGGIVMLAGVGVALASSGSDSGSGEPSTPVVAGLAVGGAGLLTMGIGAFGAIFSKPTAYERTDYDVRTRVLVPGEDDINGAARAVDEHNRGARSHCGP